MNDFKVNQGVVVSVRGSVVDVRFDQKLSIDSDRGVSTRNCSMLSQDLKPCVFR